MSDLVDLVSGTFKQVGTAFFYGYFLPSFLFVVAQVYLVVPAVARAFPGLLPPTISVAPGLPTAIDIPVISLFLLLPFVLACLLSWLNNLLISVYAGRGWLSRLLLRPLLTYHRHRADQQYKELRKLRKAYDEHTHALLVLTDENARQTLEADRKQIADQLTALHDTAEEKGFDPALPVKADLVAPTTFGNWLALASEYPAIRYGIDASLFWPRLQLVLQKQEPEYSEQLSTLKTRLDLSVNLSFYYLIFVFEIALLWSWWTDVPGLFRFILILVITLPLLGFYRNTTTAIARLSEMIMIGFDHYRDSLLSAFGLTPPVDPNRQYEDWIKLAAFLRRGERFYFPASEPGNETRFAVQPDEEHRPKYRQFH